MPKRFVAIAIALLLNGRTAYAAECLFYEPATSTISGVAHVMHGYGPPGFGESPDTDEKTVYLIVDLDHPTCLKGGDGEPNEDMANVRQIELLPQEGKIDQNLDGQHINATGKLTMHIIDTGSPAAVAMYAIGIGKD
ncbi:hypothetical protein F2P47_04470 [Parvibaculum sedimenti]|uniref:Uncharacterized protein n=1 Tax=Parvibaculum sedimenti TaxID=2608632 RepID=A0A6N6VQ57_9HYPH|nr:hypothetical protein [Parvibaculum sedimenti]KAB7741664.1 hypothetical protein F2P47_04470 [Parvibaculum sedimenti]